MTSCAWALKEINSVKQTTLTEINRKKKNTWNNLINLEPKKLDLSGLDKIFYLFGIGIGVSIKVWLRSVSVKFLLKIMNFKSIMILETIHRY